MADNAGLAAALDGIPMVADAAARDARFPLATRKQNQRVFRLDIGVQQRWNGSVWLDDTVQEIAAHLYGAIGDGTTDDRAALAAADTAAAGTQAIVLTAGTYYVATNLTITSPVVVRPGATLKPASGVTITLAGGLSAMPHPVIDRSLGGLLRFGAGVVGDVYLEWWGAVADNSTDNAAAINAALAALVACGGGTIRALVGTYRHASALDWTNVHNVTLEGSGDINTASASTVLAYTGTGAQAHKFYSVYGVTVSRCRIENTNAAFAGILLDIDGSTSDVAQLWFERCRIGANNTIATLAQISKIISSGFIRCAFWNGTRAILQQNYANIITVDQCSFNNAANAYIRAGGETWVISRNTFEPLTSSLAGSLVSISAFTGLVYTDNWHGDTVGTTGNWVTVAANGGRITGNYFYDASGSTTRYSLALLASQGVLIAGNRFVTYGGIDVQAAQTGVTIVGNDFAGAGTAINNAATNLVGNCFVAGNNNLATPDYTTATYSVLRSLPSTGTATLADVANVLATLIDDLRQNNHLLK